MAFDPNADAAVAVCFSVSVDGQDLGAFTACSGLGFEVKVDEWKEGGNQLFVHKFAGRLEYTNVTLTRPVTADTAKIAKWVASMASTPTKTGAQIVAMSSQLKPIVRWGLTGVIPVKWTGPQLSVDSNTVATETLELAHNGFDPATTGPVS
jgi:phage tail-like protein